MIHSLDLKLLYQHGQNTLDPGIAVGQLLDMLQNIPKKPIVHMWIKNIMSIGTTSRENLKDGQGMKIIHTYIQ